MGSKWNIPDIIHNQNVNLIASRIFQAIGDIDVADKNPAAVALGRLGGRRGGPARAEKLSAQERHDIAKKAALVRWQQERKNRG